MEQSNTPIEQRANAHDDYVQSVKIYDEIDRVCRKFTIISTIGFMISIATLTFNDLMPYGSVGLILLSFSVLITSTCEKYRRISRIRNFSAVLSEKDNAGL